MAQAGAGLRFSTWSLGQSPSPPDLAGGQCEAPGSPYRFCPGPFLFLFGLAPERRVGLLPGFCPSLLRFFLWCLYSPPMIEADNAVPHGCWTETHPPDCSAFHPSSGFTFPTGWSSHAKARLLAPFPGKVVGFVPPSPFRTQPLRTFAACGVVFYPLGFNNTSLRNPEHQAHGTH